MNGGARGITDHSRSPELQAILQYTKYYFHKEDVARVDARSRMRPLSIAGLSG